MWAFLNWALGLRANGCRVIWMESVRPHAPPDEVDADVGTLVRRLSKFALGDSLVVVERDGTPVETPFASMPVAAAMDAELLVNLGYDLAPSFVRRFRRSAFVDVDPGLTQLWVSQGSLAVARHDVHFTYGENVGTGNPLVPDCGIEWQYTPPPVFLPEWPVCAAESDAPYTTVSSWWDADAWISINGTWVDNSKRSALLPYLDLPLNVDAKFELAIPITDDDADRRDHLLLRQHGWSVRRAAEVSATPEDYRRYVQTSRGEFSCMKAGYSLLRTAWMGERALNYLATGKPVLLQDTGSSRMICDEGGVLRFRDLPDAVRCCRDAERDYARHCAAARRTVEEFFDAQRVTRDFLQRAMA